MIDVYLLQKWNGLTVTHDFNWDETKKKKKINGRLGSCSTFKMMNAALNILPVKTLGSLYIIVGQQFLSTS